MTDPLRATPGRARLLALALLLWAPSARAEEAADIDAMIAIARTANPDLAVAALEADAARAKVQGADSLPDPKLSWQGMDIPNADGGVLPQRTARTDKFFLSQEFPLWGKRDLKREIAEADAGRAAALRLVVENELVARIKAAYAEYHQIHRAMDLDRELISRLAIIAKQAQARYAQGSAGQQEATAAEVERAQLATELAALDAKRRIAKARLNTLLGRAPSSPLVETPHLRRVPDSLDLSRLIDQAQAGNPDLKVEDYRIQSSERSTALAEKSWYPDIGVTLGGVKSEGRFSGYEAMLEVNIPIRGALRDAEIGEARAMAGAARSRRQAKELELAGTVTEAFWSLEAARQTERLIAESTLPQARIGFESAARAYGVGRADFSMVLAAEQQWRKSHLDQILAELEGQLRLAEIEKLVGSDL